MPMRFFKGKIWCQLVVRIECIGKMVEKAMDKFCIISNNTKDKDYQVSEYIKEYIEKSGKKCVITTNQKSKHPSQATDVLEIPKDTQCAIVLGGDGTIIQAANDLVYEDLPILGVNLGTLGFLAGIEKQNIDQALEQLMNGEFEIESRMMLQGTAMCQGEEYFCGFALNDFVISKGGFCHLITIKVYINQYLIDTYVADGVIVSTPTGSTGYNLSAGGPVMAPELEATIITPICPHSLNNRSLVISSEDEIVLEIGSTKDMQKDESVIVLDGRILNHMYTDDKITVTKAKNNTNIVRLNGSCFFGLFRNKLGKV